MEIITKNSPADTIHIDNITDTMFVVGKVGYNKRPCIATRMRDKSWTFVGFNNGDGFGYGQSYSPTEKCTFTQLIKCYAEKKDVTLYAFERYQDAIQWILDNSDR